jgi:hypothetical protein
VSTDPEASKSDLNGESMSGHASQVPVEAWSGKATLSAWLLGATIFVTTVIVYVSEEFSLALGLAVFPLVVASNAASAAGARRPMWLGVLLGAVAAFLAWWMQIVFLADRTDHPLMVQLLSLSAVGGAIAWVRSGKLGAQGFVSGFWVGWFILIMVGGASLCLLGGCA